VLQAGERNAGNALIFLDLPNGFVSRHGLQKRTSGNASLLPDLPGYPAR
jgi:hypothetical protein